MCGYARRHIKTVDLIAFMNSLDLLAAYQFELPFDELVHF